MLKKIGAPYISPQGPWDNDPLKRKNEGELLTRLIAGLSGPYVIAVKGEWGSGKSVFLERVSRQLELDSIPVITINAWKTDYLEDPLVAFVSAIDNGLQLANKMRVHKDEIITEIVSASVKIMATLPSAFLGAGALGTDVSTVAVGKAVSVIGKQLLEFDKNKKTAEVSLKKNLEKARDILSKNNKIVFVIDELDRCRPDYAIKVLERIKHYYDVDGIVFVIATDGENLPNAVSSLYGSEVKGEKYLRKFFDFEFNLSKPSGDSFFTVLKEHFDFENVICKSGLTVSQLRSAHDNINYSPYQEYVASYNRSLDAFEIEIAFPICANLFKLSLRDQAQAFTVIYALLASVNPKVIIFPKAVVFAVCLRFASPELFEKLKDGLDDFKAILDQVQKNLTSSEAAAFNFSCISREINLFGKLIVTDDIGYVLSQFRSSEMHGNGDGLPIHQRLIARLNGTANGSQLNKSFLTTLNFSNAFFSD